MPSGTPRDLSDLFHELSLAGLHAVRGPRAVFRGGIRPRDRGPRALPSSGRRLATPTDDPSAESPRLACGGSLRFRVALGRGGRARCPRWKRSPWSVRRWPKRESRSTSTEVLPMTRYFWCRPTTSVVPSCRSSSRALTSPSRSPTSSTGALRASKPRAWTARSSSSTARPTTPPRSRSITARGCSRCRSAAWAVRTSTRSPTSGASTSSSATPTAPTTSGSSNPSSRSSRTASSS